MLQQQLMTFDLAPLFSVAMFEGSEPSAADQTASIQLPVMERRAGKITTVFHLFMPLPSGGVGGGGLFTTLSFILSHYLIICALQSVFTGIVSV